MKSPFFRIDLSRNLTFSSSIIKFPGLLTMLTSLEMSDKVTVNRVDGAGRRRAARKAQPRPTVPIAPTESIRRRLEMNHENFSEALGFHPSTYSGYLQKGTIVKTGALAAEALIRRQQMSGEGMDEVFVLRVIKGAATAMRVNDFRKLKLDDVEYFLIPVEDTKL
jgi:hypothetical protein